MNTITRGLKELFQYPSAVAGLAIILLLIVISALAPVIMPFDKAVYLWRGGEGVWDQAPRNALPSWVNYFSGTKLPDTIVLDTHRSPELKSLDRQSDDYAEAKLRFAFDYPYDAFPQEITLFINADFDEQRPFVTLLWRTPDGREITLGERTIKSGKETIRISQDSALRRRLHNRAPEVGLFADPDAAEATPLKGKYELVVDGYVFEKDADLDAKLVVYGQVYGLAGTDDGRRDILVALLWGTPIALAFGLMAAVGSTVSTMVIAAIGVWFSSWVDGLIQRITEVNLILPVLPILIMVGTFYSTGIWIMLSVVILLGVFSGGIKTYRAIFLQVKESPYIEAARAYGAGNMRIVFRYMIPRIIPILVPQFVVIIPSYVFLEATLAVLGLGDPVLPTWGKVLSDAYYSGALYNGYYYWVLEPAALLMVTGLGFSMLGFAMDRVFNPRLRSL